MFNSIQLADIEKLGVGIIIKNKIKNTFKGTLYNGVLLSTDFQYEVKIIYYWLGGGKLISIKGDSAEDSLKKAHELEDRFEEAFMNNENGIRDAIYKRLSLKLLCIASILLSFGMIMKQIAEVVEYGISNPNIILLIMYICIALASKYISLKANAI